MPTRETAPTGAPCWIDLLSSDVDQSIEFYGGLLGWTAEHTGPEYGGYVNFLRDGEQVAGMMGRSPMMGDTPDGWSVYLCTRDAAATAAAVEANGGSVDFPPMEVPALGFMCMGTDPGGAHIGWWQPAPFEGIRTFAEPGAPGWFELHTRDYQAAVGFYRDAMGWDVHTTGDTDEFRYSTLFEGEAQAAGIMDASGFLPEGVPAHWSIYFQVDDSRAALKRVEELGGSTVVPAEDTPYGCLATATDPNGAVFKLVS